MENSQHHPTCKLTDKAEKVEVASALNRCSGNIPGVLFFPWIGRNYGQGSYVNNKRVLILGDSHYEWCPLCAKTGRERGRDLTCRCVAELVVNNRDSIQHWHNIEYAMTGLRLDQEQRYQLWNMVSYYNFVQKTVGLFEGGGRPPKATSQMYKDAQQPFLEVLKSLSPEIVIVLGYTLWPRLPDEGPDGKLPDLEVDGKKLVRCRYEDGGKYTIACRVRHPAAGLGKPWFPVIRSAIAGEGGQ